MKNSTIALPIKPDLFLLNRRQATAHWLAPRLGRPSDNYIPSLDSNARINHSIDQVSYQVCNQDHYGYDDSYPLHEGDV